MFFPTAQNTSISNTCTGFSSHLFNGKEKDDEWNGTAGSFQDYGMRMYDTRVCKFISVDPISKKYPELTPYQFASNTPIRGIDMDGLEVIYMSDGTRVGQYGESTQVYLLNSDVTLEQAQQHLAKANTGLYSKSEAGAIMNTYACDIGMNEAELNTRAFLGAIQQTENGGTIHAKYNTWNGFAKGKPRTFTDKDYTDAPEDYTDHPGFPSGSKSSAAGAYQILSSTYMGYKEQNSDITDFSPESQDKIAMAIIDYKDAGKDIANANLESASAKLTSRKGGEQFASLPGGSQSKGLTIEAFKDIFKGNLIDELKGNSNIATSPGQLIKE